MGYSVSKTMNAFYVVNKYPGFFSSMYHQFLCLWQRIQNACGVMMLLATHAQCFLFLTADTGIMPHISLVYFLLVDDNTKDHIRKASLASDVNTKLA